MSPFVLKSSAKPFIPSAQFHKVVKRVHWHPDGITGVRRFIIEACDALPRRILSGVPSSPIRDANPLEAMPFSMPPASPTFEHLLQIHAQRPTLKDPLVRQNAVKDNFFKKWCE